MRTAKRSVGGFLAGLGNELEQLLGRQFTSSSIFFDKTLLRSGQDFSRELETAARESALLIPLISPSYFGSAWCESERLAFYEKLPHGATLAGCLAPVRVRPGDDGPHNARVEPLLRAQTYSFLADGHQPHSAGTPQWDRGVDQFALQVATALRQLRLNHKPVYVGRAPRPFSALRARVVSHLEEGSFRTTASTQEIAQSALSLHFMGGSDGEQADQERLDAVSAAAAAGGSTVIYQPVNCELTPTEGYWRDEAALVAHWIANKNEQELLAILGDELTRLTPDASPQPADLALVCDLPDLAQAVRMQREIRADHHLDIRSPEFLQVSTPTERLRQWTSLMRQSRGLLFCWGESPQQKLTSLERLACDQNRQAEREWYLFDPGVAQKLSHRPGSPQSVSELAPFLLRLKKTKAAVA